MEKQVTEEQKKEIEKLQKKFARTMAKLSFQFFLYLFLANTVVSILNVLLVRNPLFLFAGFLLNTILLSRSNRVLVTTEHDRLREEVKKILEK